MMTNTMSEKIRQKILCALDTPNLNDALGLASELKGLVGGLKLGKEFFTENGPDGVREIAGLGLPIFLDLKFHDIPNTVAGAVRAAVRLKPFMINVHASGGMEMMKRAREATIEEAKKIGVNPPLVIAVTILTSLDLEDLRLNGYRSPSVKEAVKTLALQAQECGLDGVVCSGGEIKLLRSICNKNFKLVVPGLRPPWVKEDDQVRKETPKGAFDKGADYLIIGRPITQATSSGKTPREAVEEIINDILDKAQEPLLLQA